MHDEIMQTKAFRARNQTISFIIRVIRSSLLMTFKLLFASKVIILFAYSTPYPSCLILGIASYLGTYEQQIVPSVIDTTMVILSLLRVQLGVRFIVPTGSPRFLISFMELIDPLGVSPCLLLSFSLSHSLFQSVKFEFH